jgi:heme oxygenase
MPIEKTTSCPDTIARADTILVAAHDCAGLFYYSFPRESNEARRWRLMRRNMRHEPELTHESAQRLLDAARKLPSANPKYVADLEWEFHERFGAERHSVDALTRDSYRRR